MLEQVIERYAALPTQAKVALFAAIGCVSAYLSYTDSVETARTSLEQAKAADEQLLNELNKFTNGGQSLAAIEAQKRKADEELTALFELLPKDLEIDRLLANFADAARDSGVAMVKFAPQMPTESPAAAPTPPTASPTPPNASPATANAKTETAPPPPQPSFSTDSLKRVPVSVALEGTFPQVTLFFDKILSLPRVVRLDSFKFEPGTQLVSVRVPGMDSGSATKTRLAPDGSPILRVDGQFVTFVQKGDMPNMSAFGSSNTPPPPIPVSGAPDNANGMSAKPLPTGGEK